MFKIPGSIARRPRVPWSSPYLCIRPRHPSRHQSRPQTFNSLDGLPLTILPEHACTEIMIPRAHSVTCTRRLQIPARAKPMCKRCTNMRSDRAVTMRRPRSACTVSSHPSLLPYPPPSRMALISPPTLPPRPQPTCKTRVWTSAWTSIFPLALASTLVTGFSGNPLKAWGRLVSESGARLAGAAEKGRWGRGSVR
ncbi:hypothetical protein EDB84DRAFT_1198421 [Lactarius hengduanensis]|nr:hypothetical protein EDB84DRAFT_1198421 [Lactarius hengduanensis]